ncbi:MAG: DNA integrity scanning protein DisA nucleotide-binding domain protein [Candidatus Omnitrophota bacterium]
MQKFFSEPLNLAVLVAFLSALGFLLRGLKQEKFLSSSRFLISLSCLLAAFILLPSGISIKFLRFSSVLIIVLAALTLFSDIVLGIFLRIKNAFFYGTNLAKSEADYIAEICQAMDFLARRRVGGLIILEGKESLLGYVDAGIPFDAQVKAEIIVALFCENSPVHDGAIIVSSGRIKRVKAILSLRTNIALPLGVGTRHRAAIGISEQTDAIAIIASEERGEISIAYRGYLVKVDSKEELQKLIKAALKGKNISSARR